MKKSAIMSASQVIERHSDDFTAKKVLFAGDIQDDFPAHFSAQLVRVHCTQYHYYQKLQQSLGDNAYFGLLPDDKLFIDIDTLIYYWPKNKSEAQFQLSSLLNKLAKGIDVFIVGENRVGVRSAESLLADFGSIQKIDTARRCSLYYFQAESRLAFDLDEWWQSYVISNDSLSDEVMIKSLPGVFSAQHLDAGSELLLNALLENQQLINGQILDVGCGAGVLSTVAAKINPTVELTLADVSAAALASSTETLASNGLQGTVLASDVFSTISDKFDLIISNPPFHDGRETSYFAVESLIHHAKQHLNRAGKLCIVANAFLPYAEILDNAFGRHNILLQSNKFKVYLATLAA